MASTKHLIEVMYASGWQSVSRQPDVVQFQHPSRSGEVFYNVASRNWQSLIWPLASSSEIQAARRADCYRYLLRLNDVMYLAKFWLDRGANLILGFDVPERDNQELHLARAADGLVGYSDSYGEQVRRCLLGMDPIPPIVERELPRDILTRGPAIAGTTISQWIASMSHWYESKHPRGQTFYIAYTKERRSFFGTLTVTLSWSYFQISLVPSMLPHLGTETGSLGADSVRHERLHTICYNLLRLNDTMRFAKLALNKYNQVILIVDCLTAALTEDMFPQIMRTLEEYLDRFSREIQLIARLNNENELAEVLGSILPM